MIILGPYWVFSDNMLSENWDFRFQVSVNRWQKTRGQKSKPWTLVWNYIIYYKNVVFSWLNWPLFRPAAPLIWNFMKFNIDFMSFIKKGYVRELASLAPWPTQWWECRRLSVTNMRRWENNRAAGVHHRRVPSPDAIPQKPRRSGCAAGVTWLERK